MHPFDAIIAVGTVAQVAHEGFTGVSGVLFEPFGIVEFVHRHLGNSRPDHVKKVVEVVIRIAAFTADVTASGLRIEFDGGQTGTILAPVAHFLHQ